MSYRIAKSLDKMRAQFNAHAPGRSKVSDGWIGDAAHQASTSDHNPWVKHQGVGIVTALDITHDPKNKVDTWAIAEFMRQQRDPRVKYVISNRRIFSSTTSPWAWRTYTGSNPHSSHMHVSVNSQAHHFDDTKEWKLFSAQHMPNPDSPTVRPILRKGMKGEDVRTLQRVLNVATTGNLIIDGDFGPVTETTVKTFQREQKLSVDGVVGPLTWTALDKFEQTPRASGDPVPLEDEEKEIDDGTSTETS